VNVPSSGQVASVNVPSSGQVASVPCHYLAQRVLYSVTVDVAYRNYLAVYTGTDTTYRHYFYCDTVQNALCQVAAELPSSVCTLTRSIYIYICI